MSLAHRLCRAEPCAHVIIIVITDILYIHADLSIENDIGNKRSDFNVSFRAAYLRFHRFVDIFNRASAIHLS